MNKITQSILVILLIANFAAFSSCSSKEKNDKSQNASQIKGISSEENKKIIDLISNFYEKMFTEPIDKYKDNVLKGNLADNIIPYMSTISVSEFNNIPEMKIHYPRYVELNSLTIIGYEIIKNDKPDFTITYAGNYGGKPMYVAKLNLKAKVIDSEEFNKSFERDSKTGYYSSKSAPSDTSTDFIKVNLTYDVSLNKDKDGYKIYTAIESGDTQALKYRLYTLNNNFIDRDKYLNESNKKDKEILDKDKKIISNFINSLKNIDSTRNLSIAKDWNDSVDKLKDRLKGYSFNVEEINFGENTSYKKSFPLEAFTTNLNLEKIIDIKNINTLLHPGFSEKKHVYIVQFKANVEMKSGFLEDIKPHNIEYIIMIKDQKIAGAKLNEAFYEKPAEVKKESPSKAPKK